MNTNISLVIEELEARRKKINNYKITGILLVFIAFAAMSFGSALSMNSKHAMGGLLKFMLENSIIFAIIIFLFFAAKMSKEKAKFKELYKKTFVVELLNETFDNVVYDGKMGFDRAKVREMGLARMGNRFESEDYLSGSYRGVNFSQADVKIKNESRSGKNNTTVVYFSGRMFEFEFPKVQVVGLKIFSNKFNYRSSESKGFKLEKVKMEDVQFNKQFDVRAVSSHEAFYVLTPHMMENIKRVCDKYGNVAMYITGGKLYLGFNTSRNAFDADLNHPLSFPVEKAKIQEDVEVIKNIIDVMQLED